MAYLCYHLPRHPTPDLVGWKDLIWAGRGLSGTAGSLSTSFVGCIFRRPDSLRDLRAAPRRAVEPRSGRPYGDKHEDADRLSAFIAFWALMLYVESVTCNLHVHTGRLEKKICLCCPSEGRPLTGSSRMPSEPNLFLRQNSATLRGFFPLRGCDSAAHSALQIDFRLWLVALVWASHGPPILGSQIRVIVTYRVFGTCRACVSCASGRIWAPDRGGLVFRHNPRLRVVKQGSQQRRGHALGVTAGSAAYLWLPAPGITYYSCFDYVDCWGSESHPDCTRLIPLVTSPPPAYLLSSSAAVIKPNPPPTFRCPSRTRPRRSLPLLSPYTTTFPCVNFS